jgi:hypothetical protein
MTARRWVARLVAALALAALGVVTLGVAAAAAQRTTAPTYDLRPGMGSR